MLSERLLELLRAPSFRVRSQIWLAQTTDRTAAIPSRPALGSQKSAQQVNDLNRQLVEFGVGHHLLISPSIGQIWQFPGGAELPE